MPVQSSRQRSLRAEAECPDHREQPLGGANIDLYYLGLDRKDAVFEKGLGRELRDTVGARLWGGQNGWSYNSEAMFQWGTFGANNIRAWATAHDTAYTFRFTPFQPKIGTTAGVVSGDHGNSTSTLGTFNPLFPTGIYFGQGAINLNGPLNVIEVSPYINLQVTKSLRVIADDTAFWRTSLHDGV